MHYSTQLRIKIVIRVIEMAMIILMAFLATGIAVASLFGLTNSGWWILIILANIPLLLAFMVSLARFMESRNSLQGWTSWKSTHKDSEE